LPLPTSSTLFPYTTLFRSVVLRALESLKIARSAASRLDSPPVHPFPARMPLSVASHLIGATTRPEATVLDPMAGSGTTLIAARRSEEHTSELQSRSDLVCR